MSSFADLDGLLLAALADSFTSAADLTRASRICWRLRTECLIGVGQFNYIPGLRH